MSRANASSDSRKLIVPRGSILSIVLCNGRFVCNTKAQANRALMHGLSLGVSVDMTKDIKGKWIVHLSQRGVCLLRQKHGWRNQLMNKRNRTGTRRPKDIRHPKVKVRAQMVIEDWVPGEARRSEYTAEEITNWTYGESAGNVQKADAKANSKIQEAKSESRVSWAKLMAADDEPEEDAQ